MTRSILSAAGLLLLAAFTTCSAQPQVLVSTRWVQENLGKITLVDVRERGPYERAHLPGAINVKWKTFSDPAAPKPGNLNPDTAKLAQLLGGMGIASDAVVVIYADPRLNWGEEGRMFWMLEYLGHRRVAIMDGGYPKWEAEQRLTLPGPITLQAARFTPVPVADRIITWQEIQRRLGDASLTLVDTRTLAEYNGATPYGEARGGRIPGSVHLQWDLLLDARGAFKAKPELEAALKAKGIVPTKDNVAYCTGGIRSGFVYFVMRHLGYPRERNYDGSMWEWAGRPELPIEK